MTHMKARTQNRLTERNSEPRSDRMRLPRPVKRILGFSRTRVSVVRMMLRS